MVEGSKLIVGLHIPQTTPDASQLLQSARGDGFDFVTTALPSDHNARADVTALSGRWWRTSIVGVIQEEKSIETLCGKIIKQIEWAIHMGIPAVILPSPPTSRVAEYARIIKSLAMNAQANNVQIWIKTQLKESSLEDYEILHRLCDGFSNIGIMLSMEPISAMNSPEKTVGKQMILIHKAIGMQLKAISFPVTLFLTNKKGYPTLAKSHQVLFSHIVKRVGRTVRVLVEGPSLHDEVPGAGETKCMPYLQYIRYLRERDEITKVLDTEEATMETPYLDSLQQPLQPLKDHLEFSMYETFEKDPIKYAKYQEAIYLALKTMDLSAALSESDQTVIIAVAGAGRGPLVSRAIQAFRQLQIPLTIKVYALEKNPSAIIYLESMAKNNPLWRGIVNVLNIDIRQLTRDHLEDNSIDIIVSELLGSFGDNELSPECLDPLLASACCKRTTISIPMHYTSFVAPVSSCRLYTEAKQQAQVPHGGGQPLGIQRAMETSYVVRTHMSSQTHMEQPCWEFDHPSTNPNKERSATLEFSPDPTFATSYGCGYGPVDSTVSSIVSQAPESSPGAVTIHGLLGTFTAVLFSKGESQCAISIAPHNFSKGMFSWFPLYFPFRDPIRVPEGSNLSVNLWRKTMDGKVWYEWCATVHRKGEIIATTPIHNSNGRSSFVSA